MTDRTVHPRRCGEHDFLMMPMGTDAGSSPQVRGTPGISGHLLTLQRFIPAGAGNTFGIECDGTSIKVHPRRCGEHSRLPPDNYPQDGSSPQVRGTRSALSATAPRSRFIPAGAGNTEVVSGRYSRRPVHPRRCGEHAKIGANSPNKDGSSPQVRGTLLFHKENGSI